MHFDKTWEEDHLSATSENIKALYKKLKTAILAIADDIKVYTTEKKHIAFQVNDRRIAALEVRKGSIYVWLQLKPEELTDPKGLAKKWQKHYSLSIRSNENIGDIVDLIRQSYIKNKNVRRGRNRS